MDAAWPGTDVEPSTDEPYQVADDARQRLVTIRERLAELEVRRILLATSAGNAVTLNGLQSMKHARRAADAAVRHAAMAKRRVGKLYLHSARLHEYIAGSYEIRANASPSRADDYRERAAWHRQAADQDRLNAERISPQ